MSSPDEQLLTVPQVAARFQVTAQTIRNWIDSGFLPAVRIGRAYRVAPADVEATLERAKADSGSHATLRDLWDPDTSRLPQRQRPNAAQASIWDPSSSNTRLPKRS